MNDDLSEYCVPIEKFIKLCEGKTKMEFKKYQHIEKLNTTETDGIEFGECYVFPKIDGTNGSIWMDEDFNVKCGSRTRELTLQSDNAGFYNWVVHDSIIRFDKFFLENPNKRLYGEWLVPHSLKTYRDDSWRQFYVFDVIEENGEEYRYLSYDEYKPLLEEFNINYIPPICKTRNATSEQFYNQLEKNVFLIEDGKGVGEGIVIKRYDFKNKFGRTTWAKIVTSEFKEKHAKEMGCGIVQGNKTIEEKICEKFITSALVEKEYAKIALEDGWSSKFIPRLLGVIFYCIIQEEMWSILKEFKNPKIDFGMLNKFSVIQTKKHKPELF